MLKYFILVVNTLAVIIYNLILGDGVGLSAKIPSSAAPGTDFEIEVTVKKLGVSGFAKLQVDLPGGLTATEMESKGASFTFNNHSVKYIWTALPSEEEFTIKFKVSSHPAIMGKGQIQGKFSYIENNNKQLAEFGPIDITFTNEASNFAGKDTSNKNTQLNKPDETPADVVCSRKIITVKEKEEWDVEIMLKKGAIKGFAKLQEEIPEDLVATGLTTAGANFTFSEHHAKFVWPSIPGRDEIRLVYKLISRSALEKNVVLKGEFSYLENENTKSISLPIDEINVIKKTEPLDTTGNATKPIANNNTPIETNTVAATTNTTTPNTIENKSEPVITETKTIPVITETKTEPVNTENKTEPIVTENKTKPVITENKTEPVVTENKTDNNKAGTNAPSNGKVNYKVQIGAYRNPPSAQRLASRFGISEPISTDFHDGYSKFLIGSFGEYKKARDHRENVKTKGVSDAFVTAYNSGKRITVQEALMITNQKWFK
jgi:hypothetical protein